MIVFGLVIVLCCLYGFAYLLGNDLVSVSDQLQISNLPHRNLSQSQTSVVKLGYDSHFVSPLMKSQLNHSIPLVVDAFAAPQSLSSFVHIIISSLHIANRYGKFLSLDFSLYYNGTVYSNEFKTGTIVEGVRVLKFVLPALVNVSFIHVNISGASGDEFYPNLYIQVLPHQKKNGIGVCALLSDYNSVYEVKDWIAWYKYQGLKNVLLYAIRYVPKTERIIAPVVNSGFARVYQFQWPLRKRRKLVQESIQHAQINSCFYRHKYEFDGLLFIDLDEFLYSMRTPHDLNQTIYRILRSRKGDYFRIWSTMFFLNDTVKRNDVLASGSFFSYYDTRDQFGQSGRHKYLMRTTSEGAYNVHWCKHCYIGNHLKFQELQVLHLRNNNKKNQAKRLLHDDRLKVFTPIMQNMLHQLYD